MSFLKRSSVRALQQEEHDPFLSPIRSLIPHPNAASVVSRMIRSSGGLLTRAQRRYACGRLVTLVLPVALTASAVVPPARQSTAVVPALAAGLAASGALSAFAGDLPATAETIAQDTDTVSGMMAFGDSRSTSPSSTTVLGTTVDDNINLRKGSGTEYRVIAKLMRGVQVEVIGRRNGWYWVATAKGTTGWIRSDFLKIIEGPTVAKAPSTAVTAPTSKATLPVKATAAGATVAESRVNLRKGPGTGYGSFGKMAEGTRVEVLGRNREWYKVRSPRGTIGWVARALIDISSVVARDVPEVAALPQQAKRLQNPAPAASGSARVREPVSYGLVQAASIARRYVGTRYVWGGASPRGFDCSGLVKYVYRQLGVNLPHKASLQFSTRYGQRISSLDALRPGDLVFFVRTTRARGITHVGIYAGNGRMVTANSERVGVQNVSVYGRYWRSRFAGAIRIRG